MRKIGIWVLFTICFQIVNAQEELKINYDEVKLKIENKQSEFYYPKLLTRFNEFDETLTIEEYALIYYGFTYQNEYLNRQPDEKVIKELLKKEDYKQLVIECKKILTQNPVSLSANNNLGYALFKLGKDETEWGKYQKRYRALRKVIVYSGNGLSCETAFKVIYVSDEYNMLYSYFDVETINKQTLDGLCDKFDILPTKYYLSKTIYFDISRKLIKQQELMNK